MDDVFELLSKLNVYVQGVRLIPVGYNNNNNNNNKKNVFRAVGCFPGPHLVKRFCRSTHKLKQYS